MLYNVYGDVVLDLSHVIKQFKEDLEAMGLEEATAQWIAELSLKVAELEERFKLEDDDEDDMN